MDRHKGGSYGGLVAGMDLQDYLDRDEMVAVDKDIGLVLGSSLVDSDGIRMVLGEVGSDVVGGQLHPWLYQIGSLNLGRLVWKTWLSMIIPFLVDVGITTQNVEAIRERKRSRWLQAEKLISARYHERIVDTPTF
jgi:hypothetical protein